MKFVGSIFRYVLNINTIWAWMILIAFFVCAIRHYVPSMTAIPAEALAEGENTLIITARNAEGEAQEFTYAVVYQNGSLELMPSEKTREERPRIKSFKPSAEEGAGFVMVWDHKRAGPFSVAVGDTVVSKELSIVNLNTFSDSVLEYGQIAFDLAFSFIPVFVIFLGIMKVGEDAGIVQIVARIFYPIIRFLFPEVPKDHPANGAILMNVTTTVLGLGNAATPFGLKAMEHLDELNEHKGVATNSMVMLLAYNTAGFALLPTTLIAVRVSAGADDPLAIIGTCMVAGATATITGITMAKLMEKLPIFSAKAAAAEYAKEKAQEAAREDKENAAPPAAAKNENKEENEE